MLYHPHTNDTVEETLKHAELTKKTTHQGNELRILTEVSLQTADVPLGVTDATGDLSTYYWCIDEFPHLVITGSQQALLTQQVATTVQSRGWQIRTITPHHRFGTHTMRKTFEAQLMLSNLRKELDHRYREDRPHLPRILLVVQDIALLDGSDAEKEQLQRQVHELINLGEPVNIHVMYCLPETNAVSFVKNVGYITMLEADRAAKLGYDWVPGLAHAEDTVFRVFT